MAKYEFGMMMGSLLKKIIPGFCFCFPVIASFWPNLPYEFNWHI